MNKQNFKVLLGAVTLPLVLSTLLGCSHRKIATVKVFIHGPAITKPPFKSDGSDGISVYVPRDDQQQHEMVVPDWSSPGQPEKDACKVTFQIRLVGVEPFHGRPTFASPSPFQASPFRAISFKVSPAWTLTGDSFVSMSFPSAPSIGFLEPLYPVRFQSGLTSEVPLTEVLDFPTADIDAVRLVETRTTECGTVKHSQEVSYPRMKCEEAAERYRSYLKTPIPYETTYSERRYLQEELEHCPAGTYVYFLGVGLPPHTSSDANVFKKHGISFFNHNLLPAIFGGEDKIPSERRLVSVGEEAAPGLNQPGNGDGSPHLVPVDFRYQSMRPRLVPVASIEICTAPGAVVSPQ